MPQTKKLKIEIIYDIMLNVLVKLGVPGEEAKICADVLIESDLRGIESHGIGRLKMYYDRINAGIQFPVTKIDIVRDRKATAVWDANHGMGQVVSHKAMATAIEKAEKYGMGSVAVRNSTHYGIAGYYASMAIKKNMIGMTFTNARPSIAPLFGVTPLLGTNPICFGAPSNLEFPFLYDAATSITQRGKIEVLDREEKPTPPGWAIDDKAQSHNDTKQLLVDLTTKKASLLALGGQEELLGGHKGYGLATIVEIMSAALQNGSYMDDLLGLENDKKVPYRLGHFFMAINIDFFVEVDEFKRTVGDIMTKLKESGKAPGKEHIFVAGEKEFLNSLKVKNEGVVINKNLQKDLMTMFTELSLNQYRNLFN
ncbi:MAG: Ldh family oxidoreductase [Candidatus Cloacimonetes bacterium]|nr:Ldh family oxidoreductase [Candidatus Cloacimonadota bacterium]